MHKKKWLAIILIVKVIFKPNASSFILTEEMRQNYAQYQLNKKQEVGLITLIFYFLVKKPIIITTKISMTVTFNPEKIDVHA